MGIMPRNLLRGIIPIIAFGRIVESPQSLYFDYFTALIPCRLCCIKLNSMQHTPCIDKFILFLWKLTFNNVSIKIIYTLIFSILGMEMRHIISTTLFIIDINKYTIKLGYYWHPFTPFF